METTSVFFKTVDVEGKVDPAGIRLVSNPLYEQKRLLNLMQSNSLHKVGKKNERSGKKDAYATSCSCCVESVTEFQSSVALSK